MDQLITQIGQQGVLFAGMALVIWWGVKRFEKMDDRYNSQTDKMMEMQEAHTETLVKVVGNCTEVMNQVKDKLSANGNH